MQNLIGSFSIRRNGGGGETVGTISGAFRDGGLSGSATNLLSVESATSQSRLVTFDASRVARTGVETRPVNVAYAPRIHA